MKVTVENIDNIKKKIKIEIPKEKVVEEIDDAYREFQKNTTIKGFRKGKAPRSLIEKLYKNKIEAEIVSKLLNNYYPKALDEKGIVPLSKPVMIDRGILGKDSDFVCSAIIEVKPDIDIKDYIDIEVEKEDVNIKEDDIDTQLKMLQESNARIEVVNEDRGIIEGDYVLIDMASFIDNRLIKNEKDLFLEIGSNVTIPGFESAIIGLRKGDNKKISLNIPDNHHLKEFEGKKVTFKVKIKEIKKKIVPDLDDEFAKDLGEYDSLKNLREKIREKLEELDRIRIDNKIKDNILKKIVELNPFDVPDTLVELERDRLIKEWLRNSNNRNKVEDVETIKKEFEEIAKNRVKASLIIEAIAKKESIELSEEDIEKRLNEIAEKTHKSIEVIKGYYSNKMEYLKNILIEEKTMDLVLKKSKIKSEVV